MTRLCNGQRSPKKPALEKPSSSATNPSVPFANVELSKATSITNTATCLGRVVKDLNAKNPTKSRHRIGNTATAATHSVPITVNFSKIDICQWHLWTFWLNEQYLARAVASTIRLLTMSEVCGPRIPADSIAQEK